MHSYGVVSVTVPSFGSYLRTAIPRSAPLPIPATQFCGETFSPEWCTRLPFQEQRLLVFKQN